MNYTRDLPENAPQADVDAAVEHVRAHLSAVASADDDPDTNAEDVRVRTERRGGRIWVLGELDADPAADYLEAGFDAFAGIPDELLEHVRDDDAPEVSR